MADLESPPLNPAILKRAYFDPKGHLTLPKDIFAYLDSGVRYWHQVGRGQLHAEHPAIGRRAAQNDPALNVNSTEVENPVSTLNYE